MNIYLLTHQRELTRKTNTGVLATQILGESCKVFAWDRVAPNIELLDKLKHESVALIYPGELSVAMTEAANFDSFIIIDATWQESQKIYNHSPYLHHLTKIKLNPKSTSIYTLRRNQKEAGLCTAECVIEVLKFTDHPQQAKALQTNLSHFITSYNSPDKKA
ncbi:MAG: tRNA-uridine aminocarboxypropyltransferase [Mariprofundaceae bacterium]